ncbi:MAG: glycosyltransferase family 39 protein, partial [Desulfobacterota bacterium]|nr:glycosyltransferase family 39 protein [Thermodesulfobacteriota bacterium]
MQNKLIQIRNFFFDSLRGNVLFLLVMASLVFFINLNGWDLWNPDEPRYAQVAKEMRETGEWILPHLNSEVYPEKPPLFFWLIAFFSFFTGEVNEISARLPSAISALGCILLTLFLGKKLFNLKVGFFSALALLTSVEFFWLGRRANIDMTLTLWITLT